MNNDNNKGTCFVLMAFGREHNLRYEDIYKPIIKKMGYFAKRADDISSSTEIMGDIWESIQSATILLADLSDKNPNVFYELGLAHALAKPVILITPSLDNIPFDLKHLRNIIFNTQDANWVKKLSDSLCKALHNNNLNKYVPRIFMPKDYTNLISSNLTDSLSDGLKSVKNIHYLRIIAHSTNTIRSILWESLLSKKIEECEIIVRKYKEDELDNSFCKFEQNRIQENISYWQSLKNKGNITYLKIYYQFTDLDDYFIIFNDEVLVQGVYSYPRGSDKISFFNRIYSKDISTINEYIEKFEKQKAKLILDGE